MVMATCVRCGLVQVPAREVLVDRDVHPHGNEVTFCCPTCGALTVKHVNDQNADALVRAGAERGDLLYEPICEVEVDAFVDWLVSEPDPVGQLLAEADGR